MFAYLFYAFRPVLRLLSESPLISASAVSPCSELRRPPRTEGLTHTPSTAFQHLPPNSARFSYATEGALFISAQLSTDAVSALRKVRVLIKHQALVYDILLWRKVPENGARSVGTNMTVKVAKRQGTRVNMRRIHSG